MVQNQKTIDRLFNDYIEYHRNPKNVFCHYCGVPIVAFSSVGLLIQLTPITQFMGQELSGGTILLLFAVFWYLSLDFKLAIKILPILLVIYFGAGYLPLEAHGALFVVGWVIQYVGHYYEKRSPAFYKNLVFLLIGPLWVYAKVTNYKPQNNSIEL